MTTDTASMMRMIKGNWPFLILLTLLWGVPYVINITSEPEPTAAEKELGALRIRYAALLKENAANIAKRMESEESEKSMTMTTARALGSEDSALKKAEFWYKWQHAKNGPHCARALRLVEEYEKDAKFCGGQRVSPHSLEWWCDERQKPIETNINKMKLRTDP